MPEDKIKSNQGEDIIQFPDLIELWKKIYFSTEATCTNIGKEFVSSNAFVSLLGQMRDQYLSSHKFTAQVLEKYMDASPVVSKQDVARIAELVIALEDKQDKFDLQFSDNLNSIADSLLRLVTQQQSAQNEAVQLKQDLSTLNEKIDRIDAILQGLPAVKAKEPADKKKGRKINTDERRDSLD